MSPDKQLIDLVIIIPTLNEEHFVGYLLDSIAHQSVLPKEIMVVDAYSKDKTIEEIKKRKKYLPQLRYHQIPRSTISKQRNFGVSKTKQPHILFLDADMSFNDPNLLKDYYQEVLERQPDIAAAFNLPQSENWKDQVFFAATNLLYWIVKPILPSTTAQNLYIKRDVFQKIKGFDEKVRIGEDFEFVQRCTKQGCKFLLLKKPKLHTSVRRFEREGRIKFTFRMTKSVLNILRHGYRNNQIEYRFGNFKHSSK